MNDLVKQGIEGGEEAAHKLRKSVFGYLRNDEEFRHDYQLVIKVYANLRVLSQIYTTKSVLPHATAFHDFVSGFNKAHPLCVFVHAGDQKEAAGTRIKGDVDYLWPDLSFVH